jgi:NADPH2:quinone reductase
MRAIQIHEFGDADRLVLDELPVPEPEPGEVRVKVAATGLNFVEIYQRKGQYAQPLPFIPGAEFAGTVDALGEGVEDFHVGDRVATANGRGGYAEFGLVPAGRLLPVRDGLPLELAAGVLLQGVTAHYLAISTYPLKPGDTALIHAAAGGVGQLLVQIAKRCEARVIATVSSAEKADVARQAGADEVILYTQVDFQVETRRMTGGRGVDVVYDSVGKSTFLNGLDCLKPRGMMVLYGQASGPVDPINPQLLNQKGSLFLTRPSYGHYVLTREELLHRVEDLFNWINSGELKVRIDKTFPLEEAAAAHVYLEERRTKGKVLLIP